MQRTNKFQASMVKYLVGSGNQVLPSGGALVGTGTSMNIADGQLGVISADHSGTVSYGRFIPASTTTANVNAIKIVQGTPNSNKTYNVNPFNVGDKAYVESGVIKADKVLSVATRKYAPGRYAMYLIKTLAGSAVSTQYKMNLTLESVRSDITNNMNRENFSATVETAATAPTNQNDYILQTLALSLNRQSAIVAQASPLNFAGNKPFMVLGLNIGGGSGTVVGTLTAGTSFNFAQYTVGGSTITASYTADTQFINALHTAIDNDATLSTARIVTLGSVTPGSAATFNAMLVVALDDAEALAYDDVFEFKNRIQSIGISGGALTYVGEEVSEPFEGANTGRQVYLRYKNRADLQIFTMQNHPVHGEYFIQATNYLSRTAEGYTTTDIDFTDVVDTLNSDTKHPQKAVIVLPAAITNPTGDADTGYTVATTPTTTVSHLNNILGAWLSDADTNVKNIEYKGDATKATPFV